MLISNIARQESQVVKKYRASWISLAIASKLHISVGLQRGWVEPTQSRLAFIEMWESSPPGGMWVWENGWKIRLKRIIVIVALGTPLLKFWKNRNGMKRSSTSTRMNYSPLVDCLCSRMTVDKIEATTAFDVVGFVNYGRLYHIQQTEQVAQEWWWSILRNSRFNSLLPAGLFESRPWQWYT